MLTYLRLPGALAAILLAASLTAHGADSESAPAVTFPSLLLELTDRTVLTHWPARPYRSLQASSYNRASQSPDEPAGWFANGDCGFVLRTEMRDGRKESVLMEHEGPGVLTRIWTPFFFQSFGNREGPNLRIYLDGEATPRIDANFIQLVTGKGLIPPPFAQYTCRAGDIYLPISFGKSCKVTVVGEAFYYIINYRAYAAGTKVESFHPDMLKTYRTQLTGTGEQLLEPTVSAACKGLSQAANIASKASLDLELDPGPAAIRQLEFRLAAKNVAQALRSTVLEISFDGQETVWCPLGDFFSNVNGVDAYRTWERDVRADGSFQVWEQDSRGARVREVRADAALVCRWIMPYQRTCRVRLANLSGEPVTAEIRALTSEWKWTADSLYFHTNWWTDKPYPPRPPRDLNFIEVAGRGLHVGDTLVVLNPLWSWWGEGDEKIYVDSDLERRFPSHFGTGSEDYYGWAGGEVPTRKDEFSMPFLANVRVGGETKDWPAGKEPFTHGYNICTRTRSLDATPFTQRFKFDMEAYNMIGTPDAFLQYALVTHWYGAPGATHNRPPLPEAAAAPVPQTGDVAAFARQNARQTGRRVKDAIELEDVKEVQLSPGLAAGPQHIGDALLPYEWSNGSQYWARATKAGDSATFTLLEQYQPKRIQLYPTQSYDYGILNIYVNGKLVLENWDGYDRVSKPGKPLDLKVQPPDGNVFRIKAEVVGKNPQSKGLYFGLDCVLLENP